MAEEHAVLIVAPNWVGDMVMAQCLLKALKLRDPAIPIDVIAPATTAPLVARMDEARAAIEVGLQHGRLKPAMIWRQTRKLRGRYHQAYILPGSLKSSLIPWLARIPQRTGYPGEHRYGLVNDIRPRAEEDKRNTAYMFRALADGGPLDEPRLTVDQSNQRRLCEQWSLQAGDYVVLAPGAEFGPSKRWPAEKYAALAARFIKQEEPDGSKQVIIVGGPGDREIGAEITALAPGAIDLCGRTSLLDAVDLIAGAMVAVTNDSGLMHIAAAVGAPIVAIYGSTLPDHTPPLTSRAITLTRRLECTPCFKRACPLGHMDCLNSLDVDSVENAVREVIRRGFAVPSPDS